MTADDELDRAIGEWLTRKEDQPELLPGEFARALPPALRDAFLSELEAIAAIDGMATQAPPRDLPRRYGDFRVLGELGLGAMGAVYDAEQVSTGRRVALKVMHAHVAKDLHSASRFQREARTAAALQHPGIVAVLAFGETDGAAWLAMERVRGRSLQRLLTAAGDARDVDHARAQQLLRDPRRLAQALADAAEALEYAHRHGVVHRDVKPANLMWSDDDRLVVLDFGLATAREPETVTLTRAGDFLGTPLYMAPEQAVGAENGSARSDVYALGAVLYECLCGQPPVAPGPLATVIDSILNRDPVDPRRRRDGVPEELARVAMQCLEKEPARRYPTAAALADDLRRFVDGSAVRARRSGVLARSLRRLRRRPAMAGLLALVCLCVPLALLAWKLAAERGAEVLSLQDAHALQSIDELLGGAPEGITVFGGASLRFYARLGLGEELGAGTATRSPRADQALQIAEALAVRHPHDLSVLRARARARLDVGDEPERTDAAVAAVLAHADATAADRMMAAVHARQRGRDDEANALYARIAADDASTAFWRGFWLQDQQDHDAAIAAFTQALAHGELTQEQRYRALLHRGWCRTCPDVAALREAQDDLIAAAALRPRYGTARLLWAALRCLEARTPADLGEPVAGVQGVLAEAEPWVHVLTARVLVALAEGGIVQDGPVAFGADFSPIAVMPIGADIAAALAATGLQLLDGVLAKTPLAFEPALHRIAALALCGRHGEALAAAAQLEATVTGKRRAVVALQRARVLLAAGNTQLARTAVDAALASDAEAVAAWRFRADLCGHVGDAQERLVSIERALALVFAAGHQTSVCPDAAAAVADLQLARARTLLALGRRDDAVAVVRDGPFGGALAGEFSPRVRWLRSALLHELTGEPIAAAALPPRSPLRWLAASGNTAVAAAEADFATGAALYRQWLPAGSARAFAASREQLPARFVPCCTALGLAVPADLEQAPMRALVANAALLAQQPGVEALLAVAQRALARDPTNDEARLLHGIALHLGGRSAAAARELTAALTDAHDDLRLRYLLAVTARAAGDRTLLQTALRPGTALAVKERLAAAAAAVPLPSPVAAADLLEAAR